MLPSAHRVLWGLPLIYLPWPTKTCKLNTTELCTLAKSNLSNGKTAGIFAETIYFISWKLTATASIFILPRLQLFLVVSIWVCDLGIDFVIALKMGKSTWPHAIFHVDRSKWLVINSNSNFWNLSMKIHENTTSARGARRCDRNLAMHQRFVLVDFVSHNQEWKIEIRLLNALSERHNWSWHAAVGSDDRSFYVTDSETTETTSSHSICSRHRNLCSWGSTAAPRAPLLIRRFLLPQHRT